MSVIGHADRAKPLRDYCLGLVMPGERKSVEPMGSGDGAGAGGCTSGAQHQRAAAGLRRRRARNPVEGAGIATTAETQP